MKNIAVIASICLFLTTAFVSCSDTLDAPFSENPSGEGEDGYISVTLKCGEMPTRATEDAVDNLNENKIESVTLCMWPKGGDRLETNPPVFMQTFYMGEQSANKSVTLRIPLTSDLVANLFDQNNDRTCLAFVAVNVIPDDNVKCVADLRNLVIGSGFAIQQIQNSFAMDGDGEIQMSQNRAVGTINVKRSAAKITLALNVDSEVSENVGESTVTWKPDLTKMSVRLQQGVAESTLDPNPAPNMDDHKYFNSDKKLNYVFGKTGTGKYPYVQNKPFYTYPNQWTDSRDERHRTYMMLSVPWTTDGTAWRTCYYQVPVVPLDRFETVRNMSYHINLHVGVLGSFVPEEPTEIEADYFVADWGNEDIEVDIKDYRYLVVDQNEYTVNNENEISIPFYTSHPASVVQAKMTFYRYNFSDQGSEFAVTVDDAQNKESFEKAKEYVFEANFDNTNKQLLLKHDLNVWTPFNSSDREVSLITNVNGKRESIDKRDAIDAVLNTIKYFKKSNVDEYSAVKFEIVVQHTDVHDGTSGLPADSYKETITIYQYPGMYITAVQNYAGLLEQDEQITPPPFGNTIINGNCSQDVKTLPSKSDISKWPNVRQIIYNYRNWTNSIGLGSEKHRYYNWNPNLYLITITTLPQDTKYTIGDPRSYNINNDLSNNYGNYTVDGGTEKTFKTEYWVFELGNNSQCYAPGTGSTNKPNLMKPWYEKPYYSTQYWELYELPGFITAPALNETGNRTLKYYYPTRESDDNKLTIAPKFRICSSYGGTGAYMSREMSRRRAAAYQELGYCAGRWRLPTFGEVEFVMQLSADKKIPRLFGTNGGSTWFYWCAQGAVQVPGGTVTNKSIEIVKNPSGGGSGTANAPFTGDNYLDHTRFVYDEWYWGDQTLPTNGGTPNATSPIYTFTWGDRLKSNPEN